MAFFYRFLFFLVGLMILTFGVCLTIVADFGAGAWDALNVALSGKTGLTIGTWVIIVGAILLLVSALLNRQRPNAVSIIMMFSVGLLIDMWMFLVLGGVEPSGYIEELILFIIGIIVISIGAAIYLQASFPLLPIDTFMMAVMKKLNMKIHTAKTLTELLALALALIFGGPVGVGTLIITFGIGPGIQFFFPPFEKLLQKLLAQTEINKEVG